ncbi:hypothetical protein [Cytobacillus gottheilii]|uniref:hypothetical protein n=1 Tax=Cytobacillus gottheilii TaxID=859144 RepID=UPI0009BBF9AE|nr:hypothetical protein [Cytobacillus gottheilii]
MKKNVIIITLLSLAFTLISPFVFNAYVAEKPAELPYKAVFGAPFPYLGQVEDLPEASTSYPVIVELESPFEEKTDFSIIPFVLSFLCFFLLFFSIYSIIARFMDRKPIEKEPK